MVIIKCLDDSDLPSNFTGKTYSDEYGFLFFYKNNIVHRYYGPAEILKINNDFSELYYVFNGECLGCFVNSFSFGTSLGYNYTYNQFVKDVKKYGYYKIYI